MEGCQSRHPLANTLVPCSCFGATTPLPGQRGTGPEPHTQAETLPRDSHLGAGGGLPPTTVTIC